MFSGVLVGMREKKTHMYFTLLLGNIHEVNLLLRNKYVLAYSLKNWGDVIFGKLTRLQNLPFLKDASFDNI